MKKQKALICIILCLTLASMVFTPTYSYAAQKMPNPIAVGLSKIIMGVNNWVVRDIYNYYHVSIDSMIRQKTDSDILVGNSYSLTTVRVEDNKIRGVFTDVTSKIYPKLLMLAIIVFLVGLIYIGILTILSTASAKREEYLQRLYTWGTGLLMLMAFSLIMVYLVKVNNTLAAAMMDVGGSVTQAQTGTTSNTAVPTATSSVSSTSTSAVSTDTTEDAPKYDAILKQLYNKCQENKNSLGYAVLYLMGIIQTFMFLVTYMMRTFMIAFLIIIFPVVMAIHCLDKINDNKSATFSRWFKEYTSHVFTNSIHALSYSVMLVIILNKNDVGVFVKLLALWFILPSGKLLKSIFDLQGKISTDDHGTAALAGGFALASGAIKKMGSGGGGGKKGTKGGSSSGSSGSSSGSSGSGSGDSKSGKGGKGLNLGKRFKSALKSGTKSVVKKGVGLGGAAVGATIGASIKAASGEDFGSIAEGGIAGGGMGYMAANAGMKGVGKAVDAGKDINKYGKDVKKWYDRRGKINDARDKIKGMFNPNNPAGSRFKYEVGRNGTKIYERQRADSMDAETMNKRGLMADQDGYAVKKTKINPNDIDEKSRWELRGYSVDNRGYVDCPTDECVYNKDPSIELESNNSKQLDGLDKASYEVKFDQDGNIDLSNIDADTSRVGRNVEKDFEYENEWAQSETERFEKDFNIDIGSQGSINNKTAYNQASEQISQQFAEGSQQRTDAMDRLNEVYSYSSNLETKKNEKTNQYLNAIGNIKNDLVNREELSSFFNHDHA